MHHIAVRDNGRSDRGSEAVSALAGEFRHQFLGVPVDCLTLTQTVALAARAIESRQRLQHVCINAAKFVGMRRNPELDKDVRSSDLIGVDGAAVVWAARALGIRVPERVAGIDLMQALIRLCADKGYRPYFLGSRRAALEDLVANTRKAFPTLQIAGFHDGYFAPEEEAEVVRIIKNSRPDCLFIGLPTPRKERFLANRRDELKIPFIMGVGGSFDVLAGHIRRAPRWMQISGLEWFFRTLQEPFRLAPRYLSTNAAFIAIVATALVYLIITRAYQPRHSQMG